MLRLFQLYSMDNLQISSNQVNANVYVYLRDVDEDENTYYVSEGKLRA